uniref:Putative tetraspanin n=1 Tax=Ixodes ricinus TaxID=34613 RepID=A0A090X7S0_IXORI
MGSTPLSLLSLLPEPGCLAVRRRAPRARRHARCRPECPTGQGSSYDVFDNYSVRQHPHARRRIPASSASAFWAAAVSFFKVFPPADPVQCPHVTLHHPRAGSHGPCVEARQWRRAKKRTCQRAFVKLIVKSKSGLAEVERFVDNIQYRLQCCGGIGARKYYEALENSPPTRSCMYYDSNEEQAAAYQQGCGRAIRNFLMSKSLAIGLVCLIVLLIEVFSVVSAIYLLGRK